MGDNGFRTWISFANSDEVGLAEVWAKAIVQLALLQHSESPRGDEEAPSFDDPKIVFDEAINKKLLPWWPQKLERIVVKIKATPNGSTTETIGPHPIDPNNKDIGRTMFTNIVVQLLENQGDFNGTIQIQILRSSDKSLLGGWRNEDVLVGAKAKKKKGSGESNGKDEMFEYLVEKHREKDVMIERMFGNSASVIGSAASLVNATRGVNAAPPWMNGENGEGMPFWMALMNGALQIGGSLLTGQNPAKQIQQIMAEPTQHPMLPGAQQRNMLPDNGAYNAPIGGTDQFLEGGQYDGFSVVEDDLLDDRFGEVAEESDPYEEDEDEAEEEEEEEEDEDDEPARKTSKKKDKNIFDGMDPEEVGAQLEKWMDGVKDKGKLQKVGMRLASKIMR